MEKFIKQALILFCCIGAASCVEVKVDQEPLDLSLNEVSIDNNGGQVLIVASSDFKFECLSLDKYGQWQICENWGLVYDDQGNESLECDWLVATKFIDSANTHFIMIEVQSHEGGVSRRARLELSTPSGMGSALVTVTQNGCL